MSTSYFYKTQASGPVAIVTEFYSRKDAFLAALETLGEHVGGKVAPMRDITSNYAGGVKLSAGQEHDVHWCRPDHYGYRVLRVSAKPGKGSSKEERTAARAEHKRLVDLWNEHCPASLSNHEYWRRLEVNTGNILLCGGVMFAHNGTAFFELGFQIDEADHAEKVAAGKPTSGWIDGAVEITSSEYQGGWSSKRDEKKVIND
ncbi:hypothetical protein [Pseudomonas sp. TMW 2.1634]|uniref:hypothetical protein n=1 Tax=Pseudomonas sp. TMW 2.1634 TaxID=1886807 RepID=UPI000E7112E7|nr:hypothetical protein [Pseudomonas sp. TMW 2.1634]AOA08359.1 hypothetical protein BFC21_22280 [Pseudomonas sp. TMW 2.1634]